MYDDEAYHSGYGKPPERTRFRKGVSGNPKGRPKGSRNLASIFRKIIQEKVQVNGPRGPRHISKLEAGVTQLVNRAAKGDPKAVREVLYWTRIFGDEAPNSGPPMVNIHFIDSIDGKPAREALD